MKEVVTMHMADALLAPAVGAAMYVAAAVPAGISVKKVKTEEDADKVPMMGIMGAFVFAAQMINFTVPGTGSSGHLCGGMLLTAILGPYGAFLTMISVLAIQCLLFADGGILALGANVWNMAFYGCFVGYFCIYKPIVKNGVTKAKLIVASVLGSILTLQLGAFSVTLETLISGVTELPFSVFVAVMQPIHLAIGLVEGLITAVVLCYVHAVRPEVLDKEVSQSRFSLKATVATLGMAALVIAGGLSLFASGHPDGLEWSIEQVTGSTELEREGSAYGAVSSIQEQTALLPDYGFASGENEQLGTSVSGIIGSLLVVAVCFLLCKLGGFYRIKRKMQQNG